MDRGLVRGAVAWANVHVSNRLDLGRGRPLAAWSVPWIPVSKVRIEWERCLGLQQYEEICIADRLGHETPSPTLDSRLPHRRPKNAPRYYVSMMPG